VLPIQERAQILCVSFQQEALKLKNILETRSKRNSVMLLFMGFAGVTVLAKSLDGHTAHTSCRGLPAWLKHLPNNVSYTGKRTPLLGVSLRKSAQWRRESRQNSYLCRLGMWFFPHVIVTLARLCHVDPRNFYLQNKTAIYFNQMFSADLCLCLHDTLQVIFTVKDIYLGHWQDFSNVTLKV